MKNKILIGTVAFVAVLAVIGILAVSFTMTPVLATNATNATQTLEVGCTVAISLVDNTSSGGSGSQTQTCLDNSQNATVWSSNFTTDNNYTLQNSCWSNPTPPNDGLVIKNIGNNWVQIDAELLSDNGEDTDESFTGTAGGQFFVNANNGNDDNYGFDTLDACYKNLGMDFTELTIGGGTKTLCDYLDYHNNQNHLVVNDKWILNQKTPDAYTFLLQITASEAACNPNDLPDPEDDFFTISYGTNLAIVSFNDGVYTPIDPATSGGTSALANFAAANGPTNNQATDVAQTITDSATPNIYYIPYINSGETGAAVRLYFVQATDTPNVHLILAMGTKTTGNPGTWNSGDTPWAIASDGADLTGGTPHVYILAKNSGGTWWVYSYTITAIDPTVTVTYGSRTQIITAGLPNFSRFIGLIFSGSDYYISWIDSNGTPHVTGFLANGNLLAGPGKNTDLPLFGLVSDGNDGYLGLAWTSTNAALVHETPYTFGPGAGDTRYSVDGVLPFSGGGDPRGIDVIPIAMG